MIGYLSNIEFVHPWFFLLLLALPLMWWWKHMRKNRKELRLNIPSTEAISGKSIRARAIKLLPILRLLGLAAMIVALARPQLSLKEEEQKAEGIDIVLIMDLSSSMLARDFEPDRLTVSKEVAMRFVDKRKFDRIGLAVFAGESFTQCPLTTDHRIIKEFLANLQVGMLEDGTAIGMGLATGVNRMKDSEAKSKVAILLTDGDNNAGYIKPLTAAEIAKELGVRVYSIGVGTKGDAIAPIGRKANGQYSFGVSRVTIDENLMRKISSETGGKYYRATTAEGLEQIYAEIDELEKTEIEINVFKRYSEEFRYFLWLGLILLGLELLLKYTILRTIP